MRKIQLNPDLQERLQTWSTTPCCQLCKGNGPFHRHHKRFRSHGGSDATTNLVLLCEVCHGAVHGLLVVRDGFSCRSCSQKKRFGCYFGERVLGEEIVSEAPWDIQQFDPVDE